MMQKTLDLIRETLDGIAGLFRPASPQPLPVRIRTDDQRTPPHER